MTQPMRSRLWPALKTAVQRWVSDSGALHSAALSYYAAFSLFPLCLTLIAALGMVAELSGEAQDRQRQILDMVRENIGPWLANQLQIILAAVKTQAAMGGTFGVLVLMVAALGIFLQLQTMFDSVWKVPAMGPSGWGAAIWSLVYGRIVAFLMLLTVAALVILLFVANMVLSGIDFAGGDLPLGHAALTAVRSLAAVAGNAALLALLYKTIPRPPIRWKAAVGGGLLAALVLQIGQHFLTMFVIGDYYSLYGVVGSFIAIMVWLYYASAVVFLGAEFVRALDSEDAGSRPSALGGD